VGERNFVTSFDLENTALNAHIGGIPNTGDTA